MVIRVVTKENSLNCIPCFATQKLKWSLSHSEEKCLNVLLLIAVYVSELIDFSNKEKFKEFIKIISFFL